MLKMIYCKVDKMSYYIILNILSQLILRTQQTINKFKLPIIGSSKHLRGKNKLLIPFFKLYKDYYC